MIVYFKNVHHLNKPFILQPQCKQTKLYQQQVTQLPLQPFRGCTLLYYPQGFAAKSQEGHLTINIKN